MSSKRKLNGANTHRRLQQACERLRCTTQEFAMSVSAAIQAAGRVSCPANDADCVAQEAIPYVDAVLAGRQTRLPLRHIEGTGVRSGEQLPPHVRKDNHIRAAALDAH